MRRAQLSNEGAPLGGYLAHELRNPGEQRQRRVVGAQPGQGNMQLHGHTQHALQ